MMACTTNGNVERSKYNIMPGLIVRPCQRLPRMVQVVRLGAQHSTTNRVPAELLQTPGDQFPVALHFKQCAFHQKGCSCFDCPLLHHDAATRDELPTDRNLHCSIHVTAMPCSTDRDFEDLGCTFGRILALAVPASSKTTDGEAGTMLVKRS